MKHSDAQVIPLAGKSNSIQAVEESWSGTFQMRSDSQTFAPSIVPSSAPSISSAEDSPAKTLVWLDAALDWLDSDLDFGGNSIDSLTNSLPSGFSQKTSLAFCHLDSDGIWESSSGRWLNSGMAWPGGCLTLKTSESRSDAVACSLSAIVESPGPHLAKYCLSPKACAGILRRAEKRGKKLPAPLAAALAAVAGHLTPTE